MQWPRMVVFREKVFDFSLDLRQIRPSAVFETRRRTALRGEGLLVGTRFMEFPQIPRGRGFSLLAFYTLF